MAGRREPDDARPPADGAAPSECQEEAHLAAVRTGEPGYFDPDSGLFVLTAITLAARGRCCGEGCRHCPYPV